MSNAPSPKVLKCSPVSHAAEGWVAGGGGEAGGAAVWKLPVILRALGKFSNARIYPILEPVQP